VRGVLRLPSNVGAVIAFRVLGPFEVVEADRLVALGGPKQRALLAVLVLHRGEVVSSDRLIDELWGERPPATAAKTVQVFVSELRKALGDGSLVTRGRGYMIVIDPGQVDLDRFGRLAADGRSALESGDPERAARRLREGLALWRGPPLGDLAYESFAQVAIGRLEEERLGALEDRIDADLALGGHAALVGELEALVAEHPLHERLRAQLMLALYRSGRQADALKCYQRARRGLIDELGIEPGPALKELERAILAHDPELEAPVRPSTRPATRARRGGLPIAAGGAVLLAAIALAAVMLSGGAGRVQAAPDSLAAIDPQTNTLVGVIPVGTRPGAIAYGSGSLWVANQDDRTVSRVDPQTMHTLQAIPVGQLPSGIAASADQIWVATAALTPSATAVSVSRIDPRFNSLTPVPIGNDVTGAPEAVAAQGDQVWAAPGAGLLTRLDGTTGRIVHQLDPNASPTAIAIGGDGAVWITDNSADNLTRVDPTGLLTPVAVGNGPSGIAVGEGGVWVADSLDNALVRIDPGTRAVTETIPVGNSPAGVAVGDGSVWVADSGDGTVDRIDPLRDKVIATIPVGSSPQALTVANGRVWVTVDAQSIAPAGPAAGTTLRIDWPTGPQSMDPALAYDVQGSQLLQAMCAKLMNSPDKPGPAGSQPTPEVAQSLPALSVDGRTYTFKIRPGFRFSPPSNEPVTAQTFKHSLERAFNPTMKSYTEPDFSDIVGMSAYQAGKATHISGIVARGETLVIRLVAPRPDLVARLTEQATCAVPSDTPVDPNGVRVLPSAGPYYLQSFTSGQAVVLVRNPNYHGSRPHHFERIQVAVGMSTARAVAAVKAGTADNTTLNDASGSSGLSGSLAAEASRLAAEYGPGSAAAEHGTRQFFVNPQMGLDYFVLNTHRPLFSDVRLRQAVNYAIDRSALAALGGGGAPLPDHPTDHYLPPGIPGYRDVRVYPLSPDLAKARALANGNGRTAILYTANFPPLPQQAQIVKTDLAAIGLRVQIETFTLQDLVSRLTEPSAPFDLAWGGWFPDYPDPYAMLNAVLEDGVGPAFNDPTYKRELAAAARRSGPERYLTYGKLDLDLARNGAPLAAYGNGATYDFFSARIGCPAFGNYGIDLNALCVRRNNHR
jgi:YVTN family beta-propeller protein